jgi:hypothetical protein
MPRSLVAAPVALAVLFLSTGGLAHAQAPVTTPTTELRTTTTRTRPVVLPPPSPEAAAADAEQAAARLRDEQALSEVLRGSQGRPDQSYDVKSGIQSRGLNRVLPR